MNNLLAESFLRHFSLFPASKKFAIPNLFLPFDCPVERNAAVDPFHFFDTDVTKPAEISGFQLICRCDHIEKH